jgi:tight adherence protein B
MSTLYSLFAVSAFLAVVLLLEAAYVYWSDTRSPEVKRVKRRLQVWTVGTSGDTEASLAKERRYSQAPELHALLSRVPEIERLDQLLLQAGYTRTLAFFLMVCLLMAGVGGALGVFFGWPLLGAALLALGGVLVTVVRMVWQRNRRIQRINAQLPDAMDLISRALRAGHAFSAALAMVGNQAQEPIASEFKAAFGEINFGISTQAALLNLATRVPITDMRYFVMAVVIQLETGGNLAELLTMLGNLIRDRFKLLGKIQVLAAEGKLSAYILIGLPFAVAATLQAVNPGYLNVMLTDANGRKLVMGALVMMALGSLAIWRIVKIRI